MGSKSVVFDGKRISRSVVTIRPGSFRPLQRDGSGGGPYTDLVLGIRVDDEVACPEDGASACDEAPLHLGRS